MQLEEEMSAGAYSEDCGRLEESWTLLGTATAILLRQDGDGKQQ